MQTLARADALRAAVAAWRRAGQRIACVPTMGNLHAGHLALVEVARRHADRVVATVFVNPTQFGPGEDFERYPRTPEDDAEGLRSAATDLLFLPSLEDVYPFGLADAVRVHVPALGDTLCGASRPGHFDGVASVVLRLLNLVQPDVAVFGEKDFQQLLLVRRLVSDLALPVTVIGAATVREADGLAMSSRNRYLDREARACAPALFETLRWMAAAWHAGEARDGIERQGFERLAAAGLSPDYAVIRRSDDLTLPAPGDLPVRALVAARVGSARLIDNLGIE